MQSAYPERTARQTQVSAGQIWRFLHELCPGDAVLTYDPSTRLYHLGRIDGDPRYRGQVCNANTGRTYGEALRLTIEHLFRDVPGFDAHFRVDADHPAAWETFVGDKVRFAQEVVPTIDPVYFEPFRPIFDFVQAKIAEC